jgi:hypothetical protein
VRKVLDHWSVVLAMSLITIYALFFDDIRVIAIPKTYDWPIEVLTVVFTMFFAVEILLAVFVKPKYFGSFFFWLDLVATISMVLDCKIIIDNQDSAS